MSTPTNIQVDNPYNLDLNNDGITDFTLQQNHQQFRNSCGYNFSDGLVLTPTRGNGVVSTGGWAAALHRGVDIGSQSFGSGAAVMANVFSLWKVRYHHTCIKFQHMLGPWVNVSNRYLGLAFQKNGKTHYGWALLNVQVGYVYISATLTGYAYETIAGKSIKAGQKKEAADDPTNEDFGSGAFLTSPIPDIPRTASRGALAMGPSGLLVWRREESAFAGPKAGLTLQNR